MDKMKKIGSIAYLSGLVFAFVLAILTSFSIAPTGKWVVITLAISGLAIGFLNITRKEAQAFMISVGVLGLCSGALSVIPRLGGFWDALLLNIAYVSIPAVAVVAIKTVYGTGKNG